MILGFRGPPRLTLPIVEKATRVSEAESRILRAYLFKGWAKRKGMWRWVCAPSRKEWRLVASVSEKSDGELVTIDAGTTTLVWM